MPFINGLIERYRDTEANLLCIGHGGLYWIMLTLVLKNIDTEFIANHPSFEYATAIISELRADELVCLEWNGVQVASQQSPLN